MEGLGSLPQASLLEAIPAVHPTQCCCDGSSDALTSPKAMQRQAGFRLSGIPQAPACFSATSSSCSTRPVNRLQTQRAERKKKIIKDKNCLLLLISPFTLVVAVR